MRPADRPTLSFLLALCLVCGSVVTAISIGLEPRKRDNRLQERREQLLKAASFLKMLPGGYGAREVNRLFEQTVDAVPVPGDDSLFIYRLSKNGQTAAWVLPLHGQGLWSKISGFLALENDLETVRGATFFDQKETPGLGAQIASRRFRDGFRGKKIFDAKGTLRGITVARGDAADDLSGSEPSELDHRVDGISGATWTCRAVSRMIADSLRRYEPFLRTRKRDITARLDTKNRIDIEP